MDEAIVDVADIVLFDTKTEIALFVLVDSGWAVVENHDPDSDIEFTIVDQQWVFNVFLYNKLSITTFISYKPYLSNNPQSHLMKAH